jgi:hypothetical protein
MTTLSPADTGLKWRWWQALIKNPPTSPLWDAHTCAVALVLHGFADADGASIRPTLATVAKIVGCQADTVSGRRKRLVDLGMIEQVSPARTGRATVYALCEPERWRLDAEAKLSDAALMVAIGALSSAVGVREFWSAHCEVWDTNPEMLAALKARSALLAAQTPPVAEGGYSPRGKGG